MNRLQEFVKASLNYHICDALVFSRDEEILDLFNERRHELNISFRKNYIEFSPQEVSILLDMIPWFRKAVRESRLDVLRNWLEEVNE